VFEELRRTLSKMTEIRFYHLTTTTLERALPVLLEKVLARGDRAVVIAGSDERVAALDTALWTYDDRSFLPRDGA
jgi:DNA polymerase-3 subunit chi